MYVCLQDDFAGVSGHLPIASVSGGLGAKALQMDEGPLSRVRVGGGALLAFMRFGFSGFAQALVQGSGVLSSTLNPIDTKPCTPKPYRYEALHS